MRKRGSKSANFYLPELGKGQLSSPDFSLAPQPICSDEFQPKQARDLISNLKMECYFGQSSPRYLLVDELLSFERSSRVLGCF